MIPILFVMGTGIPFTKKFPDLYLKAKGLGAVSFGEAPTDKPSSPPIKQIESKDHMSRVSTDDERRRIAEKEGPLKKALVVFGSPRGAKGFTYKALNGFLNGMRDGGIELEILFLKDYKIHPCIGCYTCWSKTPGVCIHKDDMASLLDKVKAVDLVIYAQPLYVFAVPGITKNFLDHQIPLLEPFLIERPDGSTGHPFRYKDDNRRRMLLFSVCGFPEKDHFKAMVEMFRLMSRAGGTHIIGEILRPSSESMRFGERMGRNYERVMEALYQAGKEVTNQGYVSTSTEGVISSPFLPDVHSFRNLGNRFWNTWIEYEKQKKAGRDLQALNELDEIQLSKQINLLHEELMQNPSHYNAAKGLGIAYHILATKDAKIYGPNAVKFLSVAYEKNRKDYVTMCYLGSATTMMATTTWNPVKKMSYVNKGTALMDEAVKKDPDNISVRMTRALNSKSLPSFLERGHLTLQDFEHLAGLIKKGYTNLVELYKQAGDQNKWKAYKNLAGVL